MHDFMLILAGALTNAAAAKARRWYTTRKLLRAMKAAYESGAPQGIMFPNGCRFKVTRYTEDDQ